MTSERSALDRARAEYAPRLPRILREGFDALAFHEAGASQAAQDAEEIARRFPRTYGRPYLELGRGAAPADRRPLAVGVVLSGGQAPGGHNVITGLFDALAGWHRDSRLYGFLGGPRGILEQQQRLLDAATIARFRNTGGFDMIRSGRDKIETAEQLAACRATCEAMGLDGLVVIGGDDSNTNAAVLAEYFEEHGVATRVAGVPKTIDGDLKGERVECSFGFDTATKLYAELVGNICRDARSAAKYWHFVRLMGRSASHVTLECALRTRPNVALIGEEVRERGATLDDVARQIADVVRRRAEAGREYGVCLVPEGLIEFVPEIRSLIAEVNDLLSGPAAELEAPGDFAGKRDFIHGRLGKRNGEVFLGLPEKIQQQFLLDRDAHGNVQVSQIDTELLLTAKVGHLLDAWSADGRYHGKFRFQNHFFGYEGRCASPSNFDADYTYSLGHVAAALVALGRTGYICSVRNLHATADQWQAGAVPLTSMMQMETRKGRPTPVIAKALVRTDAEPFLSFAAEREGWEVEDAYLFPGAIQYFGPAEVSESRTRTLALERG